MVAMAMVAMNEQANLQPTSNKGARGVTLTIFVTDCSRKLALTEGESRGNIENSNPVSYADMWFIYMWHDPLGRGVL